VGAASALAGAADPAARQSQAANLRSPAPHLPAASHQLHHYLHLATVLGASPDPVAPLVHVAASEVEAVRQRFQLAPNRRWLGLNAGAEYGPAKRWPIERFIAVAREAAAWPGWGVVLLGGQGDQPIAQAIEAALPPALPALRNLAGQTSLRELGAALRCCEVLLTNDTGPMHLAAAVGTPVVALFGSTSPELTGPGLPGDPRHHVLDARVACAPCFRRECPIDFRCMNALPVTDVIASLGRRSSTGRSGRTEC
jgi:heptosyltransferase-2